jgi:hypothetical protein
VPGGTPTDPAAPGGTPTDPPAPGGKPTDPAAPAVPGGTPTDPPAPGVTPTDAAGSSSGGESAAGTTSIAAPSGTKRPKVSCKERKRKRAALKAKRMLKENKVAHVQL